ncbi:MAG TPA: YihY/virulence factor BrkB family protein [Gemmataceae bacterium]|jgi:membrane protein|nr:YihY/virulence factor BrkB family protein [Gemmataceae bacterium]
MKAADVWYLVKQSGREFLDDKCPRLGAAIAFYTALSLSPLLLVVISIAGVVFGEEAARGEIAVHIQDMIGEDGAKAVETMLASHKSARTGTLMTIVGIVTLVIGASGVFGQLQDALDTVWNVPPREGGGIRGMLRDRALAFSLVAGMAFLLLVSLVAAAVMTGIDDWLQANVPGAGFWLKAANQVLSFLLTAALFAMIFKVLPHANPTWRDVRTGALLTAALFTLGKYLIGLYLGRAAVGSAYGAAGSFVVVLLWIYYSTQILLLGAEFTQVYATRFGSGFGQTGAVPKEPDAAPTDAAR